MCCELTLVPSVLSQSDCPKDKCGEEHDFRKCHGYSFRQIRLNTLKIMARIS